MSINKTNIRKSLLRLVDVVAEEADRNQEFADKLLGILDSSAKENPVSRKVVELPDDPFQVLQSEGEQGLKSWLDNLDLEQLRAIVRQHKLDSTRNSDKWKTREKFVELIMARLPERSRQGEAFRHYGEQPGTLREAK